MKIYNKALTTQDVRKMNLSKDDVLGFDFQWQGDTAHHYLTVNGERFLSFTNSRDRRKSYDKIRLMGIGWGWQKPQLTDEEMGVIQSSENGENPFAYSIICANPDLNEIVR